MTSETHYTLSPVEKNILRQTYDEIDPKLSFLLDELSKQGASECFHKHSTFKDHLFGVWKIMKLWGQPDSVCRCGLFHSAYSNSYVNLAIYKANTDRDKVVEMVGPEAEDLIYKFCTVPRHDLVFNRLMSQPDTSLKVPVEGMTVKHIKTNEDFHVPRELIRTFLIMTMADHADQYYSWQDKLFNNQDGRFSFSGNNPATLWPGDGRPGLWMNSVSRLGILVRSSFSEGENPQPPHIPPVFNNCTVILSPENERKARDLYWDAICNKTETSQHEEAEKLLLSAVELNPFIAEPNAVLAQIYTVRKDNEKAARYASEAVRLLMQWGTAWDKRMNWDSWVAWSRVLLQGAVKNNWPTTAWGIINLGLVE